MKVKIQTMLGDIVVHLYDETPIHRDNFVYAHENYNPRKSEDEAKAQQAAALMKRLNNAGRFGFPVFVVLDEEGEILHIQDSSFLEEDFPEKIIGKFPHIDFYSHP